jgi:hypothetical protein
VATFARPHSSRSRANGSAKYGWLAWPLLRTARLAAFEPVVQRRAQLVPPEAVGSDFGELALLVFTDHEVGVAVGIVARAECPLLAISGHSNG